MQTITYLNNKATIYYHSKRNTVQIYYYYYYVRTIKRHILSTSYYKLHNKIKSLCHLFRQLRVLLYKKNRWMVGRCMHRCFCFVCAFLSRSKIYYQMTGQKFANYDYDNDEYGSEISRQTRCVKMLH